MKKRYEIGDRCWIANGSENLVEGTVVYKFSLPGWAISEHYVIEIPTPIDPILEVREPMSMSDAADKPIGLWQLVSKP